MESKLLKISLDGNFEERSVETFDPAFAEGQLAVVDSSFRFKTVTPVIGDDGNWMVDDLTGTLLVQ